MNPMRLFDDPHAAPPTSDEHRKRLGQFNTPRWTCHLLVQHYFAHLTSDDLVLEPSVGTGAWLDAIARDVPAIGVEIDPLVAAIARERTGRPIIVGDFTELELDFTPSAVIGNPPFGAALRGFVRRIAAILTPGARAGLIVPVSAFSFARPTLEMLGGLDVGVDLLPRDLFPRISEPIMFLRMTRASQSRLIGFLLFDEAAALRSMRAEYRRILDDGRRPLWQEVTESALRALGGQATLTQIYRVIENYRPTTNPWWRDSVRRYCQQIADRVDRGVYRLRETATA
jgi:site-specific DNA-methyltransferase (adenine-specific)